MSVATIGKLQENTRALCKMAAKSFRSQRLISQPCEIGLQLGSSTRLLPVHDYSWHPESYAIHFTINGRHGILEARHIGEALQIPFELEDPSVFCQWSQYLRGTWSVFYPGGHLHIRSFYGGASTWILLVDVVLLSNLFPFQHSIHRRGAILDALFRISEGFYFGPHHLIMVSLIHFEEKVHRKKLQGRTPFHYYSRERSTLDKWNQLAGYSTPPGAPPIVAPLVSPQADCPFTFEYSITISTSEFRALVHTFQTTHHPHTASSRKWLRCVPIRTSRLLYSAKFQQHLGLLPLLQLDLPTSSEPLAPVEDTIPPEDTTIVEVRIPPPQEATTATSEDASSPPEAPTT
ncbi:hypothetical protein CK203_098858 [Vitis vinifera]|uniref:Uncharacterized protein n=1 Tax=Vitis vinifera TaxID=29760 RepID=A0A438DDF4_VITVI|nr:hypothetical protein CK203_098858 [Vitis vinifera]